MRYAIGLDLGGTSLKYGLVDETGLILKESIRPTRSGAVAFRGQGTVLEGIAMAVAELTDFAQKRGIIVAGIGVGAPGIVYEGLILGCAANLSELEFFALKAWLTGRFQTLIEVENDANVMALAEISFGAARGCSDAVFLTIGTGIGGALLINGSLYSGYKNRGTEMGHICVDMNGPPCTCGGRGCLEAMASVDALIRDYQSRLEAKGLLTVSSNGGDVIDGKYVISQYLLREPVAVEVMNDHFDVLAAGVSNLINIFAPQKVIIGGGITDSGDFYTNEIGRRGLARAMKEPAEFTHVERARLGNQAGFLGAASMIFTK